MKQNNLETIGGRIRKVRTEAILSIKELASRVGVTAAYLGIVERGERNPSMALLQKVAQATGSSLEWLQTGQESSAEAPEGSWGQEGSAEVPRSQGFGGQPIPMSIDAPLFLSLVLRFVPNMTKEKLAAVLDTSMEELDSVLSGENPEPPAEWDGYFKLWAKKMDLPSVCRRIRGIGLFLERQDMEKKRECLYASLKKRCEGSGYRYFIPPKVQEGNSGGLSCERITFQKEEAPGYGDVHFLFYQYEGDAKDFPAEDVVACQRREYNGFKGKETLVFTDSSYIDSIRSYYNKKETEYAGLDAMGISYGSLPTICMLLADSDTWEVSGDEEILDEPEED